MGIGGLYGMLVDGRKPPVPLAAVGLTLAAMAGGNVPAVAAGVTDPSEWSSPAWAADILPHLAYGLVTAAVHEAIGPGSDGPTA